MSVSRAHPKSKQMHVFLSYTVQSWPLKLACRRKLASRPAELGYLKPSKKKPSWGWSNSVETVQFIPDAPADRQKFTLSHPSRGLTASFTFFAGAPVRSQLWLWSCYHLSNQSSAPIFHYCNRFIQTDKIFSQIPKWGIMSLYLRTNEPFCAGPTRSGSMPIF